MSGFSFKGLLEKMGVESNPKTPGAKIFKVVQLITIPLFIAVLASKPYVEERIQNKKYLNERRLEALETKKAKERDEQFAKDHPEITQEMERYQKSLSSSSSSNNNKK
ncbi:hypothetical protein DDB_G0279749 [Dictyostelium discoideum AX4]|uniref:Uncharacterized protein n=1 Tax=Dictyostelium discoideum TaxID=44689 RepID=Q54WD1_DICDI|nr:hypothetical protein DDB_G0279749 [Dictyostelium discoideum AX4]EAL67554.1 hypothetical protein DDB_G0279749 [Dictyostelium discoideum AX4]|eukprot:XP_641527.1 hypothetical protein DDB_G0279749 [Dictyostelium discoideum AX4]